MQGTVLQFAGLYIFCMQTANSKEIDHKKTLNRNRARTNRKYYPSKIFLSLTKNLDT